MSNFNPFQVAEEAAAAVATPVEVAPAPTPSVFDVAGEAAAVEEVVVDTGKKKKEPKEPKLTKDGLPRKERASNPPIEKKLKAEMIKRYASESPAEIAASMGIEARRVYNVIRNARILLEKAVEAETDPAMKALLEQKLTLIPHKEFGSGSASGPRQNTLSIEDILNMV